MIRSISGKIIDIGTQSLILQTTSGVGYEIFVPTQTLTHAVLEQSLFLWTYLAVRENAMELFGCEERDSLRMFELLLNVSGIGPRSAMGIVSMGSLESIVDAIARGDSFMLTKVSGVGKKTAEKIVIELADKVGKFTYTEQQSSDHRDVFEALSALGYTDQQIREALQQIPHDMIETTERIREALKKLNNKS